MSIPDIGYNVIEYNILYSIYYSIHYMLMTSMYIIYFAFSVLDSISNNQLKFTQPYFLIRKHYSRIVYLIISHINMLIC